MTVVDKPDWYCAEVIPRLIEVDVVIETEHVLAFHPPVPGFGKEHVIVVPKQHVGSLLDLDADTAARLLEVTQLAARGVVERQGGCQVLTNLGDEQHNAHLHVHIASGAGVARFITRA